MKNTAIIVWFRQDLRVEDQPALLAAIESGKPIIPLYIHAKEGDWSLGGGSQWWLHYSLEALQKQLEELNLSLILRSGKPSEVIHSIIKEQHVSSLYWSRCYEPASLKRDAQLKAELKKEGLDCQSFNANLLYEPWTIQNKQGKPFQVFTPFYKHCLASKQPERPLPNPKSSPLGTPKIKSEKLEDFKLLPEIPWDKEIKASWAPGALSAKETLKVFIEQHILNYKEERDLAALDSVSHLSPHLHWGEISPRMIWNEVLKHHEFNQPGVEGFLRQLVWREFAHHLLYHFPKTPEEPLRADFKKFPWKDHPEELKKWQKGLTGYPFVDAGMRQLWRMGWMHNRLRLVVGSFLVKDLLIGWEEGAKWFWDTLVDANLANNTMGWQWVSGCGADAAPYFRIFNPITQGEKFDPEGEYVRKWVPELAHLPNQWIHKPWLAPKDVLRMAGLELGKTYPLPIVDHGKAREKALEAFAQIKANHDQEVEIN